MPAVNKPTEDGVAFSSKVIKVVFVTLLLDLLGFTLILPLLPSILDHYAETGVRFFFFFFLMRYHHNRYGDGEGVILSRKARCIR